MRYSHAIRIREAWEDGFIEVLWVALRPFGWFQKDGMDGWLLCVHGLGLFGLGFYALATRLAL